MQCYLTNLLKNIKASKSDKRKETQGICLHNSPLSFSRVGTSVLNSNRLRIILIIQKVYIREVFKGNSTNPNACY